MSGREATERDAQRLVEDLDAIRALLHARVAAEADRLPTPLTRPQYQAMTVLVGEADPELGMSLSELTARLGLAHSTVSGIVTRLADRSLVERTADPADRRVNRIRPTAAVRDWATNQRPALIHAPLTEALRALGPTRTAALLDALSTLRTTLT